MGAVATIDETGRFVGGCAWVELRLFEVTGTLVTAVSDPEVKSLLAALSRHHAWHAELWLGHRPEVAGRDGDDLVAPPTPGWRAAIAALASPPDGTRAVPGAEGSPERPHGGVALAGVVRVALPRLVAACDRHLDVASPLADGALRRTLRLVTTDLLDDWRAGERVVQDLLRTPDEVAGAASYQADVESCILAPPS